MAVAIQCREQVQKLLARLMHNYGAYEVMLSLRKNDFVETLHSQCCTLKCIPKIVFYICIADVPCRHVEVSSKGSVQSGHLCRQVASIFFLFQFSEESYPIGTLVMYIHAPFSQMSLK